MALWIRLRKQNWSVLAIGIAIVLISMIRRPDQIRYPAVWVEEGTQFIPQFLEHGWKFIFEPVNGYLILPPKICALIAYHLSFTHYPVLSYVMALLVSAGVGIVIFRAPTFLPHRWLAALIPFIIPFDPEPIGIGEYSFWFVGLLSVLGLLWHVNARPILRVSLVILGGLSAPLGVSLLPLYAVRSFATRNLIDFITLFAATLTAAVQMTFAISSNNVTANFVGPLLADLKTTFLQIVERFISSFIWAHEPIALVGVLVLILFTYWTFEEVKQGRFVALSLLAIAGFSIVLGIIRVPLEIISPMGNGPRYFFYPFIFMAWALLVFSQKKERLNIVLPMACVIALNSLTFVYRPHDELNWAHAVSQCLATPGETDLPVHFNGDASIAWSVRLTQQQCQYMHRLALFP